MGEIEIHGSCDEAFQPLKEAFAENFDDGRELGASLALFRHGRPAVDLWAGHMDAAKTKPWQEDTIVMVYSTSKIALNICVLMLMDRELLDIDEPIASYWPEFGQAGKENITTRMVLTHRAGIPATDTPLTDDIWTDWDRMIGLIERQRPWLEPGTTCYLMVNYGFVLGEIIRRLTGKSPGTFLREEVTDKIAADFHIGLSDQGIRSRVAELVETGEMPEISGIVGRVLDNLAGSGDVNSWRCQSAELPAGNGHGNARSVAKLASIMALGGTLNDVQFMSRETAEYAVQEHNLDWDPFFGKMRYGLGFGLHTKYFPAPTPTCFHWGGTGGSWCVMDMTTETAGAYAMNRVEMDPEARDFRQRRLWDALGKCLEQLN